MADHKQNAWWLENMRFFFSLSKKSVWLGLFIFCMQVPAVFGEMEQQTADHFVYLPMVVEDVDTESGININPALLFLETFDGDPASPEAWTDENWDITVHQRDQDRLYEMFEMPAHHGPNCEPPPDSHVITAYADNLYICKNHMMTANYGASDNGGYGLIYFTPNRTIDTTGDFFIQFDMSTHRVNPVRNWVDVWITPYDQNLQLAIHEFEPDLQGAPLEGIQIRLRQENYFTITIHENGQETRLDIDDFRQYHEVLQMSKKVRTTFFIGVEDGQLKVGIPEFDLWWHNQAAPDMLKRPNWSESVVQFGHHSYTPYKMCEFSFFPDECAANGGDTFHWDNMMMYPAKQFDLIHGSATLITASTSNKTFTANRSAPENSYLRFAGIGDDLEVSFDGGGSWQAAVEQAHSKPNENEHFRSYWMAVPAGTTAVQFRGNSWWGGEWAARDITIWAKNEASTRLADNEVTFSPAQQELFQSLLTGERDPNSFFCEIPNTGG
ncbi:MAG: hypothetical protein AAGD96_00660 [Chloroflexota bacterium]